MSSQRSQAFERLHPALQRWVWQQGWSELRSIQEQAILRLLDGDGDLILAAATAGGKTEAAFLPLLSRLLTASGTLPLVLCVSPLKALINDQFDRLELMCQRLEIPVYRWHGDVTATAKRRFRQRPSGVLIITPESLEALFVLRGYETSRLFAGLLAVVVDELHTFIGSERGRQLQSLLHRLEATVGRRLPRVALSATLGDMELAGEFLRPRHGGAVEVVASGDDRQQIKLQLRGYRIASGDGEEGEVPSGDASTEVAESSAAAIARHLLTTLRGGHNLVFANRRASVEEYADRLRTMCQRQRLPVEFWPHHASLSRELREDAEAALKNTEQPATVICTSTLEMGIDVGAIESVAQLGAPPSVASLRQRLGRSGRGGQPAVLRLYVEECELDADSAVLDELRCRLVTAVAMLRLLLERWYEPPAEGSLHLSTLVQQVLSLVAERGGTRAAEAFALLCREGPFQAVDSALFARLLRCLGEHDLLTQTHNGELVLGGEGERVVGHYSFYVAFTTSEEYRLVCDGSTLGTLPIASPLYPGLYLLFAGRRWEVVEVDERQRRVELRPAPGGRPPVFGGAGSRLHDRVRQEMRRVYLDREVPRYLDPVAVQLLEEGRRGFERLGLSERSVLRSGDATLVFCWRGDRVLDTLVAWLHSRGVKSSREAAVVRTEKLRPEALLGHFGQMAKQGPPDALRLARGVSNKTTEKYHRFLGEELLCEDYASSSLDVQGAWKAVCSLVE